MSRLDNDFIQRLVNTDLTTLIDRYGVRLHGGNSKNKKISCISTTHEDKNPSMSVNLDTGQFNCFGCGCSGSGAIDFFAEINGLDSKNDFRNVVESLSSELGIEPVYQNGNDKSYKTKKDIHSVLFDLVKSTLKTPYFEDDRKGMIEFFASRGITNADRKASTIGFIPKNFASSPFAKENTAILEEIGVIKKSQNSDKYYTPFGGRVTFPITDGAGNIIAIAGRKLDNESNGPKYINSDASLVFDKKNTLYGLYPAIKDKPPGARLPRMIVTEGYMDATSCKTRGFPETVATMGTAATKDHFKTIARMSDSVIFLFDGDAAGKEAANRAMLNGLPFTGLIDIKFSTFEGSDGAKIDPDEYIKTYGAEAFENVLQKARPILEYAADYVAGEQLNNLQEMLSSGLERRFNDVAQAIEPGLFRELICQQIATSIGKRIELNVSPEQLGLNLNREVTIRELQTENSTLHKENASLLRQSTQPKAQAKTAPVSDGATKIDNIQEPYTQPKQTPAESNHGSEAKVSTTQKIIPFSLDRVSLGKAKAGHWVILDEGQFCKIDAVSDTRNTLTIFGREGVTELTNDNLLVVMPERVIASKYDGAKHKKGDPILRFGGQWYPSWPEGHADVARTLLSSANPSREHLENAAALCLQPEELTPACISSSMARIRAMSELELKKTIGLEKQEVAQAQASHDTKPQPQQSPPGAEVEVDGKMPPSLLINAQPRERDFITSENIDGRVLVIAKDSAGGLVAKDPVSNESRGIDTLGQVFVIKPEGRTLSKIKSDIADIGQPIFLAEKGGKWRSSVPVEWIDEKKNQLAVRAQRSVDYSPSP